MAQRTEPIYSVFGASHENDCEGFRVHVPRSSGGPVGPPLKGGTDGYEWAGYTLVGAAAKLIEWDTEGTGGQAWKS